MLKTCSIISLISILLLSLTSCKSFVFKNQLPDITGISDVGILKSECVEETGIRGKGYAIETYTLAQENSLAFRNIANKILPAKSEWLKQDWSAGTVDTLYSEVFGVAFDSRSNESLNQTSKQIRQLLNKDGVYHSFYYKPDKDNPKKVYFFVFDTMNNKIYIIDSSV
ncbi:MAG: hypothetical protein EOP51_08395 [Sphingobacteriales bacterium]|nr:MAG: hypothetical protein EOP51_08395 [Sphingobacteriales bacterium]